MGIGTSLFLIAVGAILYFAVNADISGIEISTIGLILMLHVFGDALGSAAALAAGLVIALTGWLRIDAIASGVIGLLISLFFLSSARRGPADRTVVRDRRDVY